MMKKLHFLLLLLSFSNLFSQNIPLSNEASVSIFTCGKGEELYTTFGHTAIRVTDISHNLDVVYNYGMFDFREGNFYLKFVKGDLQYFVAATSYQDFILEYQSENRKVEEQTLNLSQEKKQQLFDLLNNSLFSDERYYTYKFIDRNCTTMVAEKINMIIEKPIIQKIDDTTISYRKVLYPYFENHFWYKLGINIIFGAKTDKKAEKLFLPIELLNSLDKAKINGKPLVSKKETIVNEVIPESPFSFINSIYFVALLLLIMALINKKIVFKSYLFSAGLLGLFLCLVGLYSYHQELLWNYNALLFNPLFVFIPFIKSKKWFMVFFGMLMVYALIMFNKPHLLIMLPFMLFTTYILVKLKRNLGTN